MPNKIDLHTHTLYSDGALAPCELVELAHLNGLQTISITDHDSMNALKEATECARDLGMDIITGVEISTDLDDKEIHLLAYFIDEGNEELQKYLSFFRDERLHRAKRMVKKLQNLGFFFTLGDPPDFSTFPPPGPPHI